MALQMDTHSGKPGQAWQPGSSQATSLAIATKTCTHVFYDSSTSGFRVWDPCCRLIKWSCHCQSSQNTKNETVAAFVAFLLPAFRQVAEAGMARVRGEQTCSTQCPASSKAHKCQALSAPFCCRWCCCFLWVLFLHLLFGNKMNSTTAATARNCRYSTAQPPPSHKMN